MDTKDMNLQKAYDSLESRYNELKGRNQRLLEHLKNREEEFNKELTSQRTKIEENKQLLRSFEDKNLELKYKNSVYKRKEGEYLLQIAKLKAMLRKNTSSSLTNIPLSRLKASTLTNLMPSIESVENTPSSSDVSERMRAQSSANAKPAFRRLNTASVVLGIDAFNKADETNDEGSLPAHRLTRSEYVKSLQNSDGPKSLELDDDQNVLVVDEKKNQGGVIKRWDINQHLEEIISEESPSPDLQERAKSFEDDDDDEDDDTQIVERSNNSPVKTKYFNFPEHHHRVRGSIRILPADVPEYIDRFNKLSQNIVSLGIKPEISMNDITKDISKSPSKLTESGSPSVLGNQLSMIKYTNINRRASAQFTLNSPMMPKAIHSPLPLTKPLFEDFFVVGPTREDIDAFITENPDKLRGTVSPKILFSYPSDSQTALQPPRSSIPDFTFPFGVDIKRIKSSPSFSGLNPIIFTSSDYEQRTKCFVFPLLSTNFAEQPTIAPDMGEVINASNPDHVLYIVCITFKDFITMTDSSDDKKSVGRIKYWEVNKAMCFMTYYPFTSFFFDILAKILNLLKVERMVKMSQLNHQDVARHEAIDGNFTTNYLNTIVKNNLKNLLKTVVPKFGSPLSLKLCANSAEIPIRFDLEGPNLAFTLEASWACTLVFRYISHIDLLWLFTALLLERKLVFLSSNIHLLTATLFVLRSLIKPFKYPYPLIFNLPEVLMVYCDAPGAALIGINKNEEYLKEQELFEQYPSCVFICLDEEKRYITPDNKVQTLQFNNFQKSLLTHYVKFNASFTTHITDSNKAQRAVNKKEPPKFTEEPEEKEKGIKVLETFRDAIETKILRHIPEKPIWRKDNNLDYEEIGKVVLSRAKEVDKKFLKEFVNSQIFIYYLEQHYENAAL